MAIKKAVGEKGDIRVIYPKIRVEVLYIDSLTSQGEVSEALKRDFPNLSGELMVSTETA